MNVCFMSRILSAFRLTTCLDSSTKTLPLVQGTLIQNRICSGDSIISEFDLQEVPKGFSDVTVFKKSQRDFLMSLFNSNWEKTKTRQRDDHNMMVTTFKDKDEDSDFSLRLVLSETQIKSWFSSDPGCRKKEEVNRVIEKGFTELSQSIDIQDNEEGGHHQQEGVVESGAPPPPPPPPPPPSLQNVVS